ncbi:MAG: serine hydrolase [Cyclobacteriaceae bacterium]|nr:serine hydrolase [Cyclobacteriaceae bacterium]
MIKSFLNTLCLFFFTISVSIAQPDIRDIENYIEKARKDWDIPGMSVAIVYKGKVASNRGYGTIEIGKEEKVDENSLFAIASNTKAFTATALGMLRDEGKLHFNDRVQRYVPQFRLYDNYTSAEATIADLLSHRVGLGTFSGDILWYKTDFNTEQLIGKISLVPRAYGFRNGYGYSNLMFVVAGEVLKNVSGESWDMFFQHRIFNPLGMKRTITSVKDLDGMGNFAVPHKIVDGKNVPIEWVNWDTMGPAGGIISSSTDMAQWLLFNLNSGIWKNDTLLNPGSQQLLWTPHNNFVVTEASKKVIPGTLFRGYGLGWGISDYFGNRVISHGGGYDGMYSQVALVPEQQLGIVILTNTMSDIADPLKNYIINAYIQKDQRDWSAEFLAKSKVPGKAEKLIKTQREARVMDTKPTFDMADYAGDYYSDWLGAIHIVEDNDQLLLTFDHAPDLSAHLSHWHYDTWEIKWDKVHAWFDFGTIQFQYNAERKITGFEFNVPNYDIFFEEVKVEKIE